MAEERGLRKGRGRAEEGQRGADKEDDGDGIECNKTRLTSVCTTRRRIDVLLIKPKG